jgi:hypothetical protein
MTIVAIYQFRALIPAKPEFERMTPSGRLLRDGLLLLRQDADERADALATAACEKHGVTQVEIRRYAALDMAALQRPQNEAFVAQYEQAMRDGSALTYYETGVVSDDPRAVASSGFSPAPPR